MNRYKGKYQKAYKSKNSLYMRKAKARNRDKSIQFENRGSLLETSLEIDGKNTTVSNNDYSNRYMFENLLERSRTQWQFGEWEELCQLSINDIKVHPERAKLALLSAAGHFQRGDIKEGMWYLDFSRAWGCSSFNLSQILIAGVHNSIGRAWSAANENTRAKKHFEASINTVTPGSKTDSLVNARAVHQTSQLGFLPQAAGLFEEELSEAKGNGSLLSERATTLQSELDLLKSELSLAQKRHQIYSSVDEESDNRNANETDLEVLRNKATSQLGQDLWVLEKTGFKRNGFFVEFGATEGVLLSNTWLLENEFGWAGICAEPNPNLYDKLKANRNCIVSDDCIAGETGDEVDFILAEEYGAITDYADIDHHKDLRKAYFNQGNVIKVKTISLDDFLEKHNAPKTIDYLSIDTEGNEFDILKEFPFDKWNIKLITVEHNFTEQREKIKTLLESYGYKRTEADWDDWYQLPYEF